MTKDTQARVVGAKPELAASYGDHKRALAAAQLLNSASAFFASESAHGMGGAVKWVEGAGGELVIFTRAEYREQLLRAADGPAHRFSPAEKPEISDEAIKAAALAAGAAKFYPDAQSKKPWGEDAFLVTGGFLQRFAKAVREVSAPAAPAEGLAADVEAVLTLLEEHEWAEHCTKTPLGQRLEAAITELHNEIHAAEEAPYGAAPTVTIDPASFEGLITAVRSLPSTRATEFDGEESDGTPQRWRNRPFVSRTQLERLLRERVAAPAAPAVDALSQAARDVLAERRRQIEREGYEPDADDVYVGGELAQAAATYALLASGQDSWRVDDHWPWSGDSLKKGDPCRMLEKAGALILAELERRHRAATGAGS